DDRRQREQDDEERVRRLPKHVSAEELRHGRPQAPGLAHSRWASDGSWNNASPLAPNRIPISARWRNFGVFERLAFASRNIYLGPSHSPPLLQNCTSEPAGAILAPP